MRLPPNDIRPLYDRVKDLLRQQIEKGTWRENALIPSKENLAKTLGVSDMTVRRALIELTDEGCLQRIRGRGTFVAPREAKVKKATHTCIGVVCHSDSASLRETAFYHRILQGMHQVADANNAYLSIKKITEPHAEFAAALKAQDLAGVVAMGGVSEPVLKALRAQQIPTVLLDTAPPKTGPAFDEVNHCDENAAYAAVNELVQLGHERIGIILIVKSAYFFQQRYNGYRRALEEASIKPDPKLVVQTHPTSQAAYNATLALLGREKRCTAIFCTIDEFAIGAIAAARDLGLAVPGDVSIAGFGDIGLFCVPALSTARIPMEQMGRSAIETLLLRIQEPEAPTQRIVYEPEWIVRASTGAPAVKTERSKAV
ncbi:MAG: GntR family transcriptional regulator [Planctomycetes bacterium]|nr:GntR family transcriptional regulator [Planctomycetota bacterium]